MLPAMKSGIQRWAVRRRAVIFGLAALCISFTPSVFFPASVFFPGRVLAQTLARRIILKDGTYQSVTKYEVKGERVRYFSAERGEWEEVPSDLVDWDATRKYEEGRAAGQPAPEAAELDKELEIQRAAIEARSPQVAPGLRLPDDGGVFLLDTYKSQPQLAEIQQSGGNVNRSLKSNILRAAINPLSGAKQNIELPEAHAKVQSHTAVPSLYVNLEAGQIAAGAPPATAAATPPADAAATSDATALPVGERFKIIRVESKRDKRVAGAVKTAVTGKSTTDERFIAATVTPMAGGWVKIAPVNPLPAGEYGIAEMLGKDSINIYVWDFGVNPGAPANPFAVKADAPETPKPDAPNELQKREKQ